MKKAILPLSVGLLAVLLGMFSATDTSHGSFHLMRVHAVMAGAGGSGTIQYVELRMTDLGQNLVAGRHLCFYDSTGAAYARFNFLSPNPPNPTSGNSILVGTLEFDGAWPGTPDKIFSDGTLPMPNNVSNMVAIAGGADLLHPVRGPSGKVSFGTDFASGGTPLCDNDPTDLAGDTFAEVDSLVYGTGYSGTTGGGTVDFPPKLNTDLPTAGTSAAFLDGQFCFPFSGDNPCTQTPPRDNDRDYSVLDVNNPDSNNPENNSGVTGDITLPDADGDGFPDASDNCPAWPNPGQGFPNTWSVPPGDSDCDGFPDTVNSAPYGRETFMGTDPVDWCADTTTANDEQGPPSEPLSPWPPDFNDNRIPSNADIILMGPTFNKISPNPLYNPRFDLNASGGVTNADIIIIGPFFNKFCAP